MRFRSIFEGKRAHRAIVLLLPVDTTELYSLQYVFPDRSQDRSNADLLLVVDDVVDFESTTSFKPRGPQAESFSKGPQVLESMYYNGVD